ncbi:excinuclease ABC subunit UvrC [Pajaroellobacter abortibovis]|uniref:UvrABC system protein C n=1 Tax=Pajaroellobacter abortibovis TaxID=1882918 RepID=A0A1L6MWH5_9BACT|nr:excinuclease ABC subunit UvrC [Pajaroellobacter abortibovis]APR99767.1 excinuclease ABC subunit C [Pajaroellobacter abortibovis]
MQYLPYPASLTSKLKTLPKKPGVYLFKDAAGKIIYVGKAKNLRSRVRSYFQSSLTDSRASIPFLLRVVRDFDTVVAGNENEALILENNLIKEYQPTYNVRLRDDKEYLSLKLDISHSWPRFYLARRFPAHAEKERVFGPYSSSMAVRRALYLVNKHFQLRTCTDTEFLARRYPCLQYHIKRCPAPCVYEVEAAWYARQIRSASLFLEGRYDELSRELEVQMKEYAQAMHFELAAVYRDQLRMIAQLQEQQRVVSLDRRDRHVIGLHREGDLAEVALLIIRKGRLTGVVTFSIKGVEIPDEEVIAAFLIQYYGGEQKDSCFEENREMGRQVHPWVGLIPPEVILPVKPEGMSAIATWLSKKAGQYVSVFCPKRGERVALLALAHQNARHAFAEKQRESEDSERKLAQFQQGLRLPRFPRRIECCDISHLGGTNTVGAIVAMTDGQLDKKRYRIFHVRGIGEESVGGDDYHAMYEVLARRFCRGKKVDLSSHADPEKRAVHQKEKKGGMSKSDSKWELPDLFVVDGGRGQLAVALAAARDLGLHDLPVVAIAKERETTVGEILSDRVYLPGQKNPIPLGKHSAALFLLTRLRDEAHRFSNRARERLGWKRWSHSSLEDIRGLGSAARTALLSSLGSIEAIRKADDATLLAIPGIRARHVKALRAAFSDEESS